jgi:hypothetical protein
VLAGLVIALFARRGGAEPPPASGAGGLPAAGPVAPRDTRYPSRLDFFRALYGALRGQGVPHVAALILVGFANKAQRGWKPDGKLWWFNFWGVKVKDKAMAARVPYYTLPTRERDRATGVYYDTTGNWRAYPTAAAAVADQLQRLKGARYIDAYTYLLSIDAITADAVQRFAYLIGEKRTEGGVQKGGYFTAAPAAWGEDVYKLALVAQRELGK